MRRNWVLAAVVEDDEACWARERGAKEGRDEEEEPSAASPASPSSRSMPPLMPPAAAAGAEPSSVEDGMAELEPMRRSSSSSSSSTGRGAVTLFFEVLPRTDDFAVAFAFAADDEGCAGDEVTMLVDEEG